MRSVIPMVALTLVLAQTVGCDKEGTVSFPNPPGLLSPTDLSGYARLENQTDHSGVLLWLNGLDSTAVTDSTGFFSSSKIPAGPCS